MEETGNLRSLRDYEDKLRGEALAIIATDPLLQEQMWLIEAGMDAVMAFTKDHKFLTDDELTLQYLGIRLFNDAASSIRLGLSGYYQVAFLLVRDVLEVGFLLDYFRTWPEKIIEWKKADQKTLMKQFRPFHIRDALDRRDGFKEKKREAAYKQLSEFAGHATYRGFQITKKDGLGEIGPFLNKQHIEAWLEEMHWRFGTTASMYADLFSSPSPQLAERRFKYHTYLQGRRARDLVQAARDIGV
jgi:hypothetical protein